MLREGSLVGELTARVTHLFRPGERERSRKMKRKGEEKLLFGLIPLWL